MIINSTAELSLKEIEKLLKSGKVETITIKDEKSSAYDQTYPILDFYLIKLKMIEFLKHCPDFDPQNPNSEKEIFTYIYLKLAHISKYDDFVCDLKHNYDLYYVQQGEDLIRAAGDLKGVFIYGESVCLGFAEALKNLLAEKNITAKVMTGGGSKTYSEARKNNSFGHAWNQVKLDEDWFNCDITFDRNNILNGKNLQYFLQPNQKFYHYSKYPSKTNQTIEKATKTLLPENQSDKKPTLISSILEKLNFFKNRTTPKQFE